MTKLILRPIPVTYTENGNLVIIATDIEAATEIFYSCYCDDTSAVLCVDVPFARWVNNLEDAAKFFEGAFDDDMVRSRL